MALTAPPSPANAAPRQAPNPLVGPPASPTSQWLVAAMAAASLLVAGAATHYPALGVIGILALLAGIAVGRATGIDRRYGRRSGSFLALVVALVVAIVIGVVAASGFVVPPIALVVVYLLVLATDWRRADGLRTVLMTAAFVVICSLASGPGWATLVGVAWLGGLLVALASLAADRRASLARIRQGMAPEPPVPALDIASSAVLAVLVALLLAVLVTAPPFRSLVDRPERRGGGETADRLGGGGRPGPSPGAGGGTGSGWSGPTDHRYHLDPQGRFIVPTGPGGSGSSPSSGVAIPQPDRLPNLGVGESADPYVGAGRVAHVTRTGERTLTATVTRDGAFEGEYRYLLRSDGLWQIDRYDETGRRVDTLYYDPAGRVVTGVGDPDAVRPREEPPRHERSWWPWVAGVGAVLAAAAGGWWWWRRRRRQGPPPGPPTWLEEVRADLERAGARRGRRRRPDESIFAYGRALDVEVGPVASAAALGQLLSDAMFAPGPHPPDDEAQARRLLGEVVATPPPGEAVGADAAGRTRRP